MEFLSLNVYPMVHKCNLQNEICITEIDRAEWMKFSSGVTHLTLPQKEPCFSFGSLCTFLSPSKGTAGLQQATITFSSSSYQTVHNYPSTLLHT
jgi:hypothetical protein